MLSKEVLITRKGKIENEHNQSVLRDIGCDANESESTDPFSKISHSGRDAEFQQDPGDGKAVEQSPQIQPVAALEVGIRCRALFGSQPIEVGLSGGLNIEYRAINCGLGIERCRGERDQQQGYWQDCFH